MLFSYLWTCTDLLSQTTGPVLLEVNYFNIPAVCFCIFAKCTEQKTSFTAFFFFPVFLSAAV